MRLADEETRRLGRERCGAEHLFLGILELPEGSAVAALDSMGVDRAAIRASVVALCSDVRLLSSGSGPFEQSGKAVLEGAMAEASALSANRISTGHMLLAILALKAEPPFQALTSSGLRTEDLIEALRSAPDDLG
jgi:ATP-dependent Clp protease ATP-binding subunit ClpC